MSDQTPVTEYQRLERAALARNYLSDKLTLFVHIGEDKRNGNPVAVRRGFRLQPDW